MTQYQKYLSFHFGMLIKPVALYKPKIFADFADFFKIAEICRCGVAFVAISQNSIKL